MPQDVDKLVQHLRQNPHELRADPTVLADRFGVSPSLVIDVFDLLENRAPSLPSAQAVGRNLSHSHRPPSRLTQLWIDAASRPAVSVLILVVVTQLAEFGFAWAQRSGLRTVPSAVLQLGLFFLMTLLCLANGRVKSAALASVAYGISLGVLAPISNQFTYDVRKLVFIPAFALLALVGNLPAAIVGGFFKLQAEQRRRENLTRQEMLERLFEIRDALKKLDDQQAAAVPMPQWRNEFKRRAWWYSFSFSFVFGIVLILFQNAVDPNADAFKASTSGDVNLAGLVLLGGGVLSLSTNAVMGFLSGSPIRALVASTGAMLGAALSSLLPIGAYGYRFAVQQGVQNYAYGLLIGALVFLIGGVAAGVDHDYRRLARSKQNEPGVLLAEMVELEWRLRPKTHRICVMVVDAAKSSVMKAQSDPFEAEWSFRAYQTFLAETAGKHLGSVHSTAGDGAVIGFPTSHDAMLAAQVIQQQILEFNDKVNRLEIPFRLRIGLHCGEVQGELDQVMFTDVIDIAAHVEAVAPVNGIAASQPVVEELGAHLFRPLNREVDGFATFVHVQPEFKI